MWQWILGGLAVLIGAFLYLTISDILNSARNKAKEKNLKGSIQVAIDKVKPETVTVDVLDNWGLYEFSLEFNYTNLDSDKIREGARYKVNLD